LTDPGYRDAYLRRRRQDDERLATVLPRFADWVQATDRWGLRASGPGELRRVGWLYAWFGVAMFAGVLIGMVAILAR
jgi:hypothetical protein